MFVGLDSWAFTREITIGISKQICRVPVFWDFVEQIADTAWCRSQSETAC